MATILRTNVSGAFWCTSDGRFDPARIARMSQGPDPGAQVCWLDNLLEGGIRLPKPDKGEKRALTVLVTGSPGTGKSTFAMELCYRWSVSGELLDDSGRPLAGEPGLSSLYVTSEAAEAWMREKAESMGWPTRPFLEGRTRKRKPDTPSVTIWQTTDFSDLLQHRNQLSETTRGIFDLLGRFFGLRTMGDLVGEGGSRLTELQLRRRLRVRDPEVLVIDSLNTAEAEDRAALFRKFMELAFSGPRILLVILESDPHASAFWDYMADLVIRLDRHHVADYMIRTLEVVKARYQSHVWGVQQLKIYEPSRPEERKPPENADEQRDWRRNRRRAHPYRDEGGIFIFPSIHYYLSKYKRSAPDVTEEPAPTSIRSLDDTLGGGLPRGRCTGFIGSRGGHKSHLGYLHLLSKIVEAGGDEKALIISLRDDEGLARETMETILRQQFPEHRKDYEKKLQELLEHDKLEILYYPPGYITPEEFFHRMYLSLQRLKASNPKAHITVLFNSLDQLSSRFPLCARQQIFIPGIIETLSAEGVTSIFIGVEESGQPPEQYGLLSMADALISFQQREFAQAEYLGHLDAHLGFRNRLLQKEMVKVERLLGSTRKTVTLRVVRFAGGKEAGAGGILELVDKKAARFKLYREEGLHFVPFSPHHLHGTSGAQSRPPGETPRPPEDGPKRPVALA